MKTRLLAGLLGLALPGLILPSVAHAATVGVMLERNNPYYDEIQNAFSAALAEKSPDAKVVVQRPGGSKSARMNALARFEVLKVDLVVGLGTGVSRTTATADRKVPLVFLISHVGKLVIPSDKNMVGVTWEAPVAQAFELLKAVKSPKSVAIVHAGGSDARREWMAIRGMQARLGVTPVLVDARADNFAAEMANVDAVYITGNASAVDAVGKVVEIARERKIPVVATTGGGEEQGVLISFAPDPETVAGQLAAQVASLLGGQSTSGMTQQKAEKTAIVVDQAEAATLGLELPASVTGAATRVIE